MDAFFENAQRIFDTASAGLLADQNLGGDATKDPNTGGTQDFALIVNREGGLHFVMNTPFALDSLAAAEGARTVYRVSRSDSGVRVEGRERGRRCLVEAHASPLEGSAPDWNALGILRDAPCYRISSPVLISPSPDGDASVSAPRLASRLTSRMRWE